MIGSFSFNNVESAAFDLICKSIKRPLLPQAKVKRTDAGGTSGIYDFGETEYEMRTISMKIAFIGDDYTELRTRARSIAGWLSTKKQAKLIIHDEPDKYYLGKVTSEIDLDTLWESGTATIVFDCQPFAYSVLESVHNFPAINGVVYSLTNASTREITFKSPPGSKFVIDVIGTWTTIQIQMHDKTLSYNFPGVDATLSIDSVNMEVKYNGTNVFHKLSGAIDTFLSIEPGSNDIIILGTGISANVRVTFIPMWM